MHQSVSVSNVSAERLPDFRKLRPAIQINTDLSLTGMEKKPDNSLEVPFVLSINHDPSVVQISLKRKTYMVSDKVEVDSSPRIMNMIRSSRVVGRSHSIIDSW